MGAPSYLLLSLGVFVSVCALHHSNARRSGIVYLQRSGAARTIVLASSWIFLAATFCVTGGLAGWELAVPVWLCLLGTMGIASLFIAALSRRWHLAAGAFAGAVSLLGGAAAAVSGWLS